MRVMKRYMLVVLALWLLPASHCIAGENASASVDLTALESEGDSLSFRLSIDTATRVKVVDIVLEIPDGLEFLSWEDGDFVPHALRIGPALLDGPRRLLVALATPGKTVVTESSGAVGRVKFVRSQGSSALPAILEANLIDDRFREDRIVTPSNPLRPSPGSPEVQDVPVGFALRGMGPNPMSRHGTVRFDIPRPGSHVSIRIYDVRGRLVRILVNEKRAAGHYSEPWDLTNAGGGTVAPGVYFCRMEAGNFRDTKKLVLLK